MQNNNKKLSLVVDLVNKTEKQFNKLSADLADAESRVQKTSAAFKRVGAVSAVALTGLVVGVGAAVKQATMLEESINAVNVVFGAGAKKMLDFGKVAATQVGLANGEFNQMSVLTGALLKDTGKPMEEVADITIMLTKRAADLASVFNTDVSDAMGAINQAIRGETEGIRRYAGNISVAELNAYALANGIGKTVEQMTEQEKRLLRVQLIMSQTATAHGDFENTQNSLANQSRILAAQFKNIAATIGDAFVPMITKALGLIRPLIDAFAIWVKENTRLVTVLGVIAIAIAAVGVGIGILGIMLAPAIFAVTQLNLGYVKLSGTMSVFAATHLPTLTKTMGVATASVRAKTVAMLGLTAGTKAATVASRIFNATLIGALIAGIIWVTTNIYKIIKGLREFGDTVGGVGRAWHLVMLHMTSNFWEFVKTVVEGFDKVLSKVPGMGDAMSGMLDWVNEKVASTDAAFDALAVEGIQGVIDKGGEAGDAVTSALDDIMGGLDSTGESAEDAAKTMEEAFSNTVDALKEIRDEITAVYDEMKEATSDFKKATGDEEQDYQNDVVKMVAGAHAELKELEEELKDEKKKDADSDLSRIKTKIAEQKEIISTYNKLELNLDKEIAEERKRLRMNELERLAYDHAKKLEMMQFEFVMEQLQRLQRLNALKVEHNVVMSTISAEQQAKANAEIAKTTSVREQLAEQRTALAEWMSSSLSMYSSYVKSVNGTLSKVNAPSGGGASSLFSGLGKRALGGPVSANGSYVVGEKGPELFTPSQYGTITANNKMGGGGITVVFTGNHFTDDRYAEQIQRKIVKDLKTTMKLSLG